MSLLLPVGPRRMSSWADHQRRSPRSSEPGTDFYCPIGTPVYAPESGNIYGYGNSITPATGRWVGIDLVTGQRFRAMHFSQIERFSGWVNKGELIAFSGATGYGDNDWSWNPDTGGAHTHATLWPTWETRFGYNSAGRPYTVDFMDYVGSTAGGGGGSDIPPASDLRRKGNNMIRFLYADNGGPQWTVIDYANGSAFRAYNQADANNLSQSVGFAADVVSAQDLANAIALAEGLSGHKIRYIN